jgi:hypothetical protein
MKHTPEPWEVVIDDDGNPLSGRPSIFAAPELDCGIVHWDGFVQPYWRSARGDNEIHANAARIVACVNALEGIANPAAIPMLVAEMKLIERRLRPHDEDDLEDDRRDKRIAHSIARRALAALDKETG